MKKLDFSSDLQQHEVQRRGLMGLPRAFLVIAAPRSNAAQKERLDLRGRGLRGLRGRCGDGAGTCGDGCVGDGATAGDGDSPHVSAFDETTRPCTALSVFMPRMARAVLAGVPHHLTQRGVNRQAVFLTDGDRRIYLELARESALRFSVELLGYCLMTNHVHWIVVPGQSDSLAKAFAQAHGRYAHYANAVLQRSGHFWQNRFFSCALEPAHLWAALRYVERNPVRAGLVEIADQWPWSSPSAHTGRMDKPDWLDVTSWSHRFTHTDWLSFLGASQLADAERLLRSHTYAGRPLGSQAFVESAELTLGRRLQKSKGGRPAKASRSLPVNEPAKEAILALDR